MNKIEKYILLLLLLLTQLTHAQQYPVELTPVLMPPYSLRLGDYATTSEDKLRLQLHLRDLMEPSRRIRLRFTLESGLNSQPVAQSVPYVEGMKDITLYPGAPQTLTNVELRPLFHIENLSGMSAAQYSKPLPQGLYRFCFQAVDASTGKILSAKTCATAYMVQYDPPKLNLPQQAEKIQKRGELQFIVFQWMPRQVAPNTSYTFTLKELWDSGRDPVSGFQTSRVLWQEETPANSLSYGIDKTALIPGKRYVWQVQAKSGSPVFGNSPTEDNGVYKNNGLSEIYYFDFVEDCQTPVFLSAQNSGRGKTQLRWSMAESYPESKYHIQYRKRDSNTSWQEQESYTANALLTGLKDETEYEYRIGSVCGGMVADDPFTGAYAYSNIQYFTTDSKKNANSDPQCGILPKVDLTNRTPLNTLLGINEVFMAGDFPVTVTQAEGNSGTYSGEGYIQVPYLADTKIKVSFKSIQLNSDKQLIGGVIETTYDINESSLNFVSDGIGETFGDGGASIVQVPYSISEVKYSVTPPPGRIIISGNSGAGNNSDTGGGQSSTQELPAGKDYTITDKDGNVWQVDEKGNVTKGGKVAEGGASNSVNTQGVSGSGSKAKVDGYTAKGVSITWDASASKYAYDSADDKPEQLKNKYPTVTDANGNTVYVPYKAVVNGQSDELKAKLTFTDESLKENKVIFKTLATGSEIQARKTIGNDYTLTLKGTMDYAEEDVIAVLMPKDTTQQQQVIGSFKLVHLEAKTINVALVATDDKSSGKLDDIMKLTNAIWEKAGVTVNFIKDDQVFDITPYLKDSTVISTQKNTLLSTYSSMQQAINKAYGSRNSERYVLFVTDKPSSTGQMGYMRLSGQFGYVFGSATSKTVAHELGHGVFKLEHPWEQYKTTEGSTNLLMDYANGSELTHLDWKQINDPKLKLYAFQGQGEGIINLKDGEYLGFTPKGHVITKRPDDYEGVFLAEGTYYITGFKTKNGTYKWVENEYKLGDKSFSALSDVPISGKVAVWKDSPYPDCFALYHFIDIKDYKIADFGQIQQKVAAILDNDWQADYVSKANTSECEKLYSAYKETIGRTCSDNFYLLGGNMIAFGKENHGDRNLDELDNLIQHNATLGYQYGSDLTTVDVKNPTYISVGANYKGNKIFDNYTLEELDKKMAYLEVSSSYKLYTMFFDVSCTQSVEQANQAAKLFFENSKIDKQKGILCLVISNSTDPVAKTIYTTLGFAAGSDIESKPELMNILKTSFNGIIKKSDLNFTERLIETYSKIPKKRVIINYSIEKIDDAVVVKRNAEIAQLLSEKTPNGYIPPLVAEIRKKETQYTEGTGQALDIRYFIYDGVKEQEIINQYYTIKEEYVIAETSENGAAEYVARTYASKFANWDFTYYKSKEVNENDYSPTSSKKWIVETIRSSTETFFDYYYSLRPSKHDEIKGMAIDAAFFTATLVTGTEALIYPTAIAVIYYTSTEQYDKAIGYLAGYGLVKVFSNLGTAYQFFGRNLMKFNSNLKTLGFTLRLETAISKGVIPQTEKVLVENLFNAALKDGHVEYAIPKNIVTGSADDVGNYYIKASLKSDGSEVLIGEISAEGKLIEPLSYSKNYSGINNTTSITDDVLKETVSKLKMEKELISFVNKTLSQKLDDIANAWKASYPEIFVERQLFEDLMGYYRYTKNAGWGHTADIAPNFKAIDFYKDYTVVGDKIYSSTAISMKTTTTKSVDSWLATNAIKKNIAELQDGMGAVKGITWNNKTIYYNKAEIHIYMPKENFTPQLKTEWLNTLSQKAPNIDFKINTLEDFIK